MRSVDPERANLGSVEIVEVIRVVYNRGRGTSDSVVRNVSAYYDKGGALLFETDPMSGVSSDMPGAVWIAYPSTAPLAPEK